MNKEVLRETYLEKRLMLSGNEWDARCRTISRFFFEHFDVSKYRCIHVYLPMDGRNEPDVWQVVNPVKSNFPETRICISRSVWRDRSLRHYLFESPAQLEMNKYGIPEPREGVEITDEEIDLVLVPLIAFDLLGNRIGYGGGFYDRFLAKLSKGCQKVGYTIAVPLDEIPFTEPFDVPLDSCICPLGYHQFH